MKNFKNITNLFFSEVALLDIRHNFLAFLLGCAALSPLIGFLPTITPVYYMMLMVVAIYMVFNIKKVELIAFLLIVASALSIILASPPSFFKSWGRLGLFILLFIAVSPLMQSMKARKFRESLLQLTLFISVIVALVSFVFYFLGINYMGGDTYSVGRFGGLTRQSMVLGPVSAIATIYCSYRALSTKNKLYWMLAVPCMACVLFAASRSAFLSVLLGLLAMFYLISGNGIRFMKRLLPIIGILVITYPLWGRALSGLEEKQQKNVEMGGTYESREDKWSNRIEEFRESPVWGVGFSACDPLNYEDYNRDLGGTVEPGSSWLAVLSMTGILGFIPFGIIIYKSVKRVWSKRRTNIEASLYLGLIVFLSIHMLVEGFILAGGSVLCFIAWIIISCCYEFEIEK